MVWEYFCFILASLLLNHEEAFKIKYPLIIWSLQRSNETVSPDILLINYILV